MQQENVKKSKKLGWLIAGLAVLLVVVGVVLAIILMPGEQAAPEPTGPVGGRPQLYWNIDRKAFLGDDNTAGLSKREAGEDGLYHLRFAIDGKQVEYTIADKRLVNVIDTYDVVGLVFDEAGNVIDGIDPTTIATEVAKGFFVMRHQGNRLDMNSSFLMNGMASSKMLSELTEIYNVSNSAETVGMVDTLQPMDKVMIYANDKEEITHIYIVERQPEAEVYWRADRKYDSATASTSRVPDENGVYTIPFAYKGKHVELKCKDKDLVSEIDKVMIYACPFGLLFDEQGYIVDTIDPAIALRGMQLCSSFNITAIDGDDYTATYLMSGAQNGEEVTFTVTEDTEIYNCCIGGSNEFIGEATKLQMMDRVMVYSDMDGNPLLIYVMYRMVDSPIYYNIERKYSDAKAETTRVPDANGFYVFEMAVNGKQVTLKTRDKDLASKVDSFAYKMLGLKVNGNIIEKVYTPYVVCGSDAMSPATERFVVGQTGTILSFAAQGTDMGATTNKVMMPTTEVVDVSGYPGTKIGEKTTVREGDKIRVLQDVYGNLTHVYITERYTGYPIYYNYTRYYSATAGTTREPDAEGYYVFEMASQGKQVTVKTKDKTLADYIDKQSPNIVALKVDKNGIVTNAAPAQSSVKFGRKAAANGFFSNIVDGVMNFTLATTDKTYSTPIASNYTAYNCGQVYDKFRGEKTKLKEGDQIVAIRDDKLQQVVEVYIIQRKVECDLYYNAKAMYNTVTKETTRVPDADGWYIFDMAVNGAVKQYKTKDKTIASFIDSKGSSPVAMIVNGDVIKQAFPVTAKKGLKAFAVSNYDVMSISDGKCTLTYNIPGTANSGKTLEVKLASNYKAYNVSSYAEKFGEQVKLNIGDRVICYYNDAGEIEWLYIWYRNTRAAGAWSLCSHCNKEVYWMPYTAAAYAEEAHVYLTHDRACPQVVVGACALSGNKEKDLPAHGEEGAKCNHTAELILDLNGHTMSTSVSADRLFVVYGGLSVLDSVGTGKIEARNRDTATAAGAIMVQKDGTFNLYSGTLTGSAAETKISNGGIVYVGDKSAFKMYGGTITGGKATNGGNVYVANGGNFEMYGGTITGGTAKVGSNVWVGKSVFLMSKGVIDGDVVVTNKEAQVTVSGQSEIKMGKVTGLQLASGVMLPLVEKMTADTKVVIEAAGVFTEQVADPSAYLQNFTSFDSEFPVFAKDGALACGRLAECEHCKTEVFWSRFVPGTYSTSEHLVLLEDTELTGSMFLTNKADVHLDLNGKTLSTKADRAFAIEGSTLAIQDAVGGGKIVGRASDKEAAAGTIMVYAKSVKDADGKVTEVIKGELFLYSGELAGSGSATAITNGGVVFVGENANFSMLGGTITGTNAKQGGSIYASKNTTVTIDGGKITGGAATFGGNIFSQATVIVNGGEIVDGQATVSGKGGNIYSTAAVRINDGNISGGSATNGGNVFMASGNVKVVGGTITGGTATNGGNIFSATGNVIVEGGTVENGVADAKTGKGGNIYTSNAAITIGLATGETVATVSGGTANMGGNIYSAKLKDSANKAVTIAKTGLVTAGESNLGGNIYVENTMSVAGSVTNGKASDGGNIYTKNWSDIYGTVSGGVATTRGGNIFVNGTTAVLYNGAVVEKGTAVNGGNIVATGDLTVKSGAKVADGTATTGRGGNIYMIVTGETRKTLTVEGQVLGGTAAVSGAGIAATAMTDIVVNGGEITGALQPNAAATTVTVSGAAKISNLNLSAGGKITLGELTDGADIVVDASGEFADVDETTKEYVKYFRTASDNANVGIHVVDNALVMGILGNCEKCNKDVLWSPFSAAACTSGAKHLKLEENVELSAPAFVGADADITLDLNGHTLSTKADRAFAVEGGKLTIQDSVGSGKILGRASDKEAAAGTIMVYAKSVKDADGKVTEIIKGELYLYSGELAGSGEATAITNGGVVFVGENATFHMVGGTITGTTAKLGGSIYASKNTTVTIDGGKISGGVATSGGNIYSMATVVINNGEVVGGEATSGGNIYGTSAVRVNDGKISGGNATNGGNVFMASGNVKVVGGTITGGTATNGGNIFSGTGKVIVEGGTVEKGVADATTGKGGNIYASSSTITIGLTEGEAVATVSGGTANMGGNIYSAKLKDSANKAVTIAKTGLVTAGESNLGGNVYSDNTVSVAGSVTNGKASDGGNIYTKNWSDIYGTVTGGEATTRGGNIFASGSTVVLYNGAVVENGTAVNGGNIVATGDLTVKSGAKVADGTATTGRGGNIYMIVTGETRKTLTVEGQVLGGTAAVSGAGIAATAMTDIVVNGGEITGALQPNAAATTVTVSGAAKISNLNLSAGGKITLGELTDGADIVVDASGEFADVDETTKDYIKYFHTVSDSSDLGIHIVDNVLVIGVLSRCEKCDKDVQWAPFSVEACTSGTKHLVLNEDVELTTAGYITADVDITLDLNGHTISTKADRAFAVEGGKLTIQDSVGGGKIVGRTNEKDSAAGTIMVYAKSVKDADGKVTETIKGELYLYSGELCAGAAETKIGEGGVLYVGANSIFNMYGGKITGGTAIGTLRSNGFAKGGLGGNLYIGTGAVVNIYDGEISGGKAISCIVENFDGETGQTTVEFGKDSAGNKVIGLGGNIYSLGKLNVYGGTISGGDAYNGGNIYGTNTVIIDNGTVSGGKATLGGNIYSTSALRVNDGVITAGEATNGGNIYMAAGAVNLVGGVVSEGVATPVVDGTTVTEGKGGNIYAHKATVTVGATEGDVTATVTGGKAYRGGNIYSAKPDSTVNKAVTLNVKGVVTKGEAVAVDGDAAVTKNIGGNIYIENTLSVGGVVSDGKASDGGNIYTKNWTDIYGTVTGGEATTRGGNIFASGSTVVLYNGAAVENGTAVNGGNIVATGNLTVKSGAKVADGTATTGRGGNIYMIVTGETRKTLTVEGQVLGGTAAVSGAGIAATAMTDIVVNGGEITGVLQPNDAATTVTVSGAAKISNLNLSAGGKIALGEMTEGANVVVDVDGAFADVDDTTKDYAVYFHPASDDANVGIHVMDNMLVVGILGHCEKCDKDVLWAPFSAAACTSGTKHLKLEADVELSANAFVGAEADITLDLNGHSISTKADRAFAVEGGKLTIQDSVGGGKIVGRANDTEAAAGTIMVYSNGVVNLYSGEICGSDAETKITNGGVLFVGSGSSFNMYGGEITGTNATLGGSIYGAKDSVITISGGKVSGGTATEGGNIYSLGTTIINNGTVSGGVATLGGNIHSSYAVSVKGGTISDGTAENGGNIYMANLNLKMTGGTISGGKATNGGNIYSATGKVMIEGGTVENGVADAASGMGGNIYAANATVNVGVAEGDTTATVTGGTAYMGGNICSDKLEGNENKAVTIAKTGVVTAGEATLGGNIYSENTLSVAGSVTNGKASDGGNLYTRNWTDIYGTISSGEAITRGGNVFANGSTVILYNGAVVANGTAVNGGNIVAMGNLTVKSGAKVADGTATTGKGGNIYMIVTGEARKTLTVEGQILGGTAGNGGAGIAATEKTDIVINGGEVTGVLQPNAAGTQVTVSGAAKISNLNLSAGAKVTLGDLTDGANIVVDSKGVISNASDKAADYATYFHALTSDPNVAVHVVDNALVIGILRKCEQCNADVLWEAFSAASCTGTKHLLLTGDATVETQLTIAETSDITIDLNGYTLTASGVRFALVNGKLTIQDSSAEGKGTMITTNASSRNGGLLGLSATGVMELYSGTLTMAETAQAGSSGGIVSVGDGVFTMHGGTITGGKLGFGKDGQECQGANVYVRSGSFTMNGGVIDGSAVNPDTITVLGGSIYGGTSADGQTKSVITINVGEIKNGIAAKGGNIYSTGTTIVKGGTISGGSATLGGNIHSTYAVSVQGGTISGGTATNGGNVYMASGNVKVTGGTISGGNAVSGGNIYSAAGKVILEGGTVENGVATPNVTTENNTVTIAEGLGGNIYIGDSDLTVGLTAGDVVTTVTGGKAYRGGNIYAANATGSVAVNAKGIVTSGEAVAVEGDASNGKHLAGNIYSKKPVTVYGEITGGKGYDGGNIYVENTADIYGTVSGGEAASRGGNIFANGNLNVQNGAKVENGTAVNGGNVAALRDVTVDTGALVSGGNATTGKGGNIYMIITGTTRRTLTVKGQVLGGAAGNGGAGIAALAMANIVVDGGEVTGEVLPAAATEITVSGAAKLSNLNLTVGAKVTLGELTEGANIVVSGTDAISNENEKAADYAGYFAYVDAESDIGVHAVDNVLVVGIRRYCSECQADVMWDVFSAGACNGTNHLILTGDVELSAHAFVGKEADTVVDLNGHTLSTKGDRVFAVEGGTLSIQDTKGNGKVVGRANTNSGAAGTIMVYSSGALNLYSGELAGSGAATGITNGGVVSVGASCTFNMYGGTITGTKAQAGGAIHAGTSSTVTIYDGTITGGTAEKGGNIYSEGVVKLISGLVSNGQATLGGNIYSKSAVRNEGAIITGGQAANGGNIYMEVGTANLLGGTVENGVATPVVVEGVTTEGMGGNIYAEKARIMVGADSGEVSSVVSCGQAYLGGNIYSKSVDASLEGQAVTVKATGIVIDGQATNGGNIFMATDKVTVQGGVFDGVATPVVNGTTVTEGKGGNIYAEFALVVVGNSDGSTIATVSGGKAYRGGNIYSAKVGSNANKAVTINAKGVVTLGEAVAVDGDAASAKNLGGNIYSDNTMTIHGAVTDGKADDGGNIYAANWTGVYAGATISGGQAVRRGGNIFAIGTLELSGGVIENGEAVNGGNIAATGAVNVLANVTVQNGTATTGRGGNIYMIITGSTRKTLTVKGKVLGGTAAVSGAGIAATGLTNITVDGGQISGVLQSNDASAQITVSGAAKIDNLILASGQKLTLGALTTGADITVSATGVFTNENENAASYAAYFKPADKISVVGNTLSMG